MNSIVKKKKKNFIEKYKKIIDLLLNIPGIEPNHYYRTIHGNFIITDFIYSAETFTATGELNRYLFNSLGLIILILLLKD